MPQNFSHIMLQSSEGFNQFHYIHITDQTYISRGPCFNIPLFKNTKWFHVTKIAEKYINRQYGKTMVEIANSGTFINLYLSALFTIA